MTDQELANQIHRRAINRGIKTPELLAMLDMGRATFWRLRSGGGLASRKNADALQRVAKDLRKRPINGD